MKSSLRVGIVVERRISSSPWQMTIWRVCGIILGGGPDGDWREIARGEGWTRFFAGNLDLTLYPDEAVSYAYNLQGQSPMVYVVLRHAEGLHEMVPFLVTACPVEAQDYMGSGDDVVEAVAMPQPVAAWVHDFVTRHPVREEFVKRRRSPKSRQHPGNSPQEERYG